MTTAELLSYLRNLGIRLWLQDNQLRYRAPDGVMTPALRTELIEHKGEIIAFLRDAEGAVRAIVPPILPVSRDGELPLSYAQQRLWFIDLLEPNSAVYNIPAAVRLVGTLNVNALWKSLNEIVRRHEVLRTTFTTTDGRPVQVIATSLNLAHSMIDLGRLSKSECEAMVQRLATQEALRPFDLARGPLIRAMLLRLAEDEHVLLLTMHHIVSDAWSTGVSVRELAVLYRAFIEEKPSPLTELSIQYADFAVWQRLWLQGEVLETQLSYWKQQLNGAPAVLELPTNHPRPLVPTFQGATQPFTLPQKVSEALRELSQRGGVTVFMVLLAVFKVLLYRYTGQEDVVVGSPIANRNRSEIEGLIGFFVNTLVLRTDLSGNPTFGELLGRVREVTLGAYAHQDLPFELLVEELQPERDMSRNPLFEVVFALQNTPLSDLELTGVALSSMAVESGTAKFDLVLLAEDTVQGLRGVFEYKTALFEAETVRRMVGHYRSLVEGVVVGPERRLRELPLLTDGERQQLLSWNVREEEYAQQESLGQRFEVQVEQCPDATAVVYEGQQLTYQGLNERANRLAHYLRAMGVGPEERVGLCVERSLEMVVGLLGIVKAGGAYVPLDPWYPRERMGFMLEDMAGEEGGERPVLLTQGHLVGGLPEHEGRVVCLDSDWERMAHMPASNLTSGATPATPVYVIYTSGSTGVPKGVVVSHENVVRLFKASERWFGFGGDDIWTVFHSYAFDFSVWELWGGLLYGGQVVVVPYEVSRSPEVFYELLQRQRVTVLNQIPSAFGRLMGVAERAEEGGVGALRWMVFGGEALELGSLRSWFERYGEERPRMVNMYGITETTVHVTYRRVRMADVEGVWGSVIGRAIPDLAMYILEPMGQGLVPIGVAGELYVGGAGLARGYLKRPALTAERFIPNPYGCEPGERLYKTGDLARYLPNGDVEYLGRIDHQVKVRGFRIELGEIEAALVGHVAVREAVVVARAEEGKEVREVRLVAYLVVGEGPSPTVSELRQFLKSRLPDYMVPAAYVMLTAWPLTPSGKIDRRALSPPDTARPELEGSFVAPRTPTEKVLAEIWAKVLQLDRIGVHDNFFELGGDSILSLQIIAKANQSGLHLAPRQLFQYQTIAELAAVAESSPRILAKQDIVTGLVPLVPIQQWFFEQNLPDPHYFNQALLLEARQHLGVSLLMQTLQQLLLHHDALRMRFEQIDSSTWRQINTGPDEMIPCVCLDLSALVEADKGLAIGAAIGELQGSLDLKVGPLIRVAFFRLGERRPGRLFICAHHLVVDGVSWRVLLEDLQRVYGQLERGEAIELAPKTTSFKEWAERLVVYAQSSAVLGGLSYWQAEVWRQVVAVPLDHPEGRNTVASAERVLVSLGLEETEALLREVPKAYRTQMNDVLLTALARAWVRWTGEGLLLVAMEGHGREMLFEGVDLTRTVGWFTAIFPVLIDVRGLEGWGESLKGVKEQLRQIPGRGVNYGVVRYLREEDETVKRLAGMVEPEVSFNYLGQMDRVLSESGLLGVVEESSGQVQSQRGMRRYVIEVNGSIVGGQLQVGWTYSRNLHERTTMERVAESFKEELRGLVAHCIAPGVGGYTPSDFPEARLRQGELDRLIARYEAEEAQIDAVYPLSPTQQGMLFHSLYAPTSGVYFQQLTFTLHGNVQVFALRQAWDRLLMRHTILRSSFYWEDLDEPLQIVFRQVELPWEEHDWCGLSLADQEERLEVLLQTAREQGFDFAHAPLMRLHIIRMADNTHCIVWSHHHILLDGWSMPLLFKEAFAFYEALCCGQDLYLEPPRPYRDYVSWLTRQNLVEAESFWRHMLQDFTAPTPLGVDQPLVSIIGRDEQYDALETQLSGETTTTLRLLSQQHNLTLSTVVQGIWAVLLSRYSGEDEVVFGVTVSGRQADLPGIEAMIGLFINTLPVRVWVTTETPVAMWLKDLQTLLVEARQYEYSSLQQIRDWCKVPRGLALFESILVFENYPAAPSLREQRTDLKIGQVCFIERTNYPITIFSSPGNTLPLKISYDCRRFDADTVQRMLGHLQTLLEELAADFDRPVCNLQFLTEAERQQLLVEWNNTQVEYSENQGIHELFEAQVERIPDAVAVVFENQNLTYRELDARANQVAHYLRGLGVGPEVLVSICAERSPEMMVGLLGILKAGGAYVPLDPAYPKERQAFVLADTQSPALLSQSQLVGELPIHQTRVVCLDTDWEIIACMPRTALKCTSTPDNLVYTIHTSGSTGRPKGVQILRRAAVNFLEAMRWQLGFAEQDILLSVTTLSFDIAVLELFLPLVVGARLELVSRAATGNGMELMERLNTLPVTVMQATPVTWRLLLGAGWQGKEKLKILCGGEVLSRSLANQLLEQSANLWNLYGPTETTVWSTAYQVTRGEDSIPIGHPIDNTQIYLLDAHLSPVPVGMAAVLYIGGVGLARGYLGRPDLTADNFVPNPFSMEAGTRLYRTGDVARYLSDGVIEFLGRVDHQVKVRGFRIELGEIETVLEQYTAVREAIVVSQADKPGDERLVAYVAARDGQEPTTTDLRRFLQQKLPDYMIPSAFVMLETLPLTPNGKVDRRALPVFDGTRPNLEDAFVPPCTPVEEVLADIWVQILGVEQVGIHDNFFDLGGHSLLATQVISYIRNTLQVEIPLRMLFEAPTIAGLAAALLKDPTKRVTAEKSAQLLVELAQLSEDEVEAILIQKPFVSESGEENGA